jgi:hypothetical protein
MLTNAQVIFGLTDATAAAEDAEKIHTLNSFNSTFKWGTYLRETSLHMDSALVRQKPSCYHLVSGIR